MATAVPARLPARTRSCTRRQFSEQCPIVGPPEVRLAGLFAATELSRWVSEQPLPGPWPRSRWAEVRGGDDPDLRAGAAETDAFLWFLIGSDPGNAPGPNKPLDMSGRRAVRGPAGLELAADWRLARCGRTVCAEAIAAVTRVAAAVDPVRRA